MTDIFYGLYNCGDGKNDGSLNVVTAINIIYNIYTFGSTFECKSWS